MDIRNRIRGSLIGGAVGDALGYAIEFRRGIKDKQVTRFGARNADTYDPNFIGQISDDTQMTLFTANALIRSRTKLKLRGHIPPLADTMYLAYLDWLCPGEKRHRPVAWIRHIPATTEPRAPGATCVTALDSRECSSINHPINDSKGCGGIMRVAPIGLYKGIAEIVEATKNIGAVKATEAAETAKAMESAEAAETAKTMKSAEAAGQAAADCCALTHGHPIAILSAYVMAALIHLITYREKSLPEAIEASMNLVSKAKFLDSLTADRRQYFDEELEKLRIIIRYVCDSAAKANENCDSESNSDSNFNHAPTNGSTGKPGNHTESLSDLNLVAELGEGWVAEEALAIALFSCLKYQDSFEDAVVCAVNHDGDSDSTGSIAGNIMGALLGYDKIPDYYKDKVELKNLTLELADDLTSDIPDVDELVDGNVWYDKYIKSEHSLPL